MSKIYSKIRLYKVPLVREHSNLILDELLTLADSLCFYFEKAEKILEPKYEIYLIGNKSYHSEIEKETDMRLLHFKCIKQNINYEILETNE